MYLSAVFSYDTDEVTAGFIVPVLLHIQGAEFAEAVCGEQNFFCAFISDHDFRPVYHRRVNKVEHMLAQRKGTAVLCDQFAVFDIHIEEIIHHGKCFFRGYHDCIRISIYEILDIRRVIRLHMLYDQIVRFASIQHIGHVVQPFMGKIDIHRVHDSDLLVQDHIGIIRHAVRNHILSFKQVYLMVVDTHIADAFCNVWHRKKPPFFLVIFL